MTDSIGSAPSEHGEAASDESGQTVQDAVEASYDTWDENEFGIRAPLEMPFSARCRFRIGLTIC